MPPNAEECNPGDSDHGVVSGARFAHLWISETANVLRFLCTTVHRYTQCIQIYRCLQIYTKKTPLWVTFLWLGISRSRQESCAVEPVSNRGYDCSTATLYNRGEQESMSERSMRHVSLEQQKAVSCSASVSQDQESGVQNPWNRVDED